MKRKPFRQRRPYRGRPWTLRQVRYRIVPTLVEVSDSILCDVSKVNRMLVAMGAVPR